MPGAHSYTIQLNLTNSTLNHGPGSMDSAGKRAKSQNGEPAHGPPLQARVAAANGTVRTTSCDDPGTHGNEQGAKQNWTGANDEGSGHGMAKASRHTKPAGHGRCRQTQPADDATGTGLAAKQQPADGRPRSKTTAAR